MHRQINFAPPDQRSAVRNRPLAEQKPGTGWMGNQIRKAKHREWLMEETGRESSLTFCGDSIITIKMLTLVSQNVQE